MKQIGFISGKGGTWKRTLVASLAHLVQNKMLANCDVDAPNLHLLLGGAELFRADYSGGKKAAIDPSVCIACGRCRKVCRFNAIRPARPMSMRPLWAVLPMPGWPLGLMALASWSLKSGRICPISSKMKRMS